MINPEIIYEDNDLIVINKPEGVVVNRSQTAKSDTLQDFVSNKVFINDDQKDTDFAYRCGLIHRLDKDTSGLVLVAKNLNSFENLINQFKQKKVEKGYIAVILGELNDACIEIRAPLKRNPYDRKKFAVVKDGRLAVTYIEKVKTINISNNMFTLVKIIPYTGRTHQIRVHLASINHPVAGDIIYSGAKRGQIGRQIFGRMMLHAQKLGFEHPVSKKHVIFEAKSNSFDKYI